ncbi:MAG: sugar transferase, partial [Dehalococcoidia bacterium]
MGVKDSGGPRPHEALQPAPTSGVRDPVRKRLLYSTLKRAFDLVIAALALLALSPLFALVALLIKLDSRGPVFFIHRREGRHGRSFPCVKFRTMHRGAHQMQRKLYAQNLVDGPQFKMRADPRVTRLGRYLRRTNLDELPQLINVLLGHVSLVGPRPSPFRENQICVPWRRGRLSVRPGITGLWQICRDQHRESDDFQQWIYYDMAYIRHMSICTDIKILLGTALTLGGHWRVPLSWMTGSAGTQRATLKLRTRFHEPACDVMKGEVYSST